MRNGRFVGFLLCLSIAGPAMMAQDVARQAMRHELERTMEQLQLEELSKPYFVSYTIQDSQSTRASASFGSLLDSDEDLQRYLRVEVRVGGYNLDNTNFLTLPNRGAGVLRSFFGRVRMPLEDDYREIRRQLWLATDSAYKSALEALSKKRAALQNKTRSEELPDFSKEEPATIEDAAPPVRVDRDAIEALVRRLSERFREMDVIHTSKVRLLAATERTRYLNSEGSSFDRTTPSVGIEVTALTQAEDGLPLADFVSAYGRSFDDLPAEDELAASIDRMGERLSALRHAPLIERYNGPVLFEGQAAAELMAQAFARGVLASRKPVAEDARMASFLSSRGGQSLEDKIGARVMPRFLAVVDDPTQDEFDETILLGGYKVDDQGVPARPTTLIERGMLKTLLSDRTPVTGVEHSSGNRRAGGVMPSNIIVRVDEPLSAEELKQELLLLVQDREGEYGVVVRRVGNPRFRPSTGFSGMIVFGGGGGDETKVSGLIEAYKIYPDGREELIRNAQISGISPAAFKDVVAASSDRVVYTAPFTASRSGNPFSFGFSTGSSAGPPSVVSWVMPSLLFEDMTLKKPGGEVPRPPVAEHPFFDRPDEE